MRSRMTQLATAAMIAVVIILGVRGINGTTAWAAVVKALNSADNIHVLTKVTRPGGEVAEYRTWLKDNTLFRAEESDEITIDNGEERLVLDLERQTAQFSDSRSALRDYMETGNLEIILLFGGKDTPYEATELTDERTATERVYKVTYRDIWEGKAWVDGRSNLPLRIEAVVAEAYQDKALDMTVIYTYEPIPPETFDLAVPAGYTELPARFFSGVVVDEAGQPVVGAEVVTSREHIRGKTNEQGQFAIKLDPGRGLGRLPMFVRAIGEGEPSRVAWTVLRNPRHELRPLFVPDDGKTKLEQGFGVEIYLVDETSLGALVPLDSGTLVFQNDADRHPSEVKDMALAMGAGSVISGRVTDREDRPIAGAVVWLDRLEIAGGGNRIVLRRLGRTDREKEELAAMDQEQLEAIGDRAFALTDTDGSYELGHLPDRWQRIRLAVQARCYVREARRIFRTEGNDFALVAGDITIRGTVIDNYGQPLVGREVEIDVDSDTERDLDVEETVIDGEGRFELTGVPAVDGLEVQIRADEKPRDWDRNELTRGREFIYYLMIEEPIALETGKKEYSVEIVPARPDMTLEIEAKNSEGLPLEGVPVGVCSPGNTERVWYVTKLNGQTDRSGVCTIEEVPRIEPLDVWIGGPPARQTHYWENDSEVNRDVKSAIGDYSNRYRPTVVSVKWTKDKKAYPVSVTLEASTDEPDPPNSD
jgi:outer membrane lipoprotein-sorting protein